MADLNIGNSSASVVVNAKHNGSVIPQINNTYDLGTSALKWKNIYGSTFVGSLNGNAATATKATQDSANQQINTTYIKGLSASGRTITYTKGDGTTGTITTQDSNTTYSAGTGLALSGTKFSIDSTVITKDSMLQTTNPFGGSSLYISKIDNAFYAADKRWTVTGSYTGSSSGTYSISQLSALFDGNYETALVVPKGCIAKIRITFDTNETTTHSGVKVFPGYPYGYAYISYYYNATPSTPSKMRMYCNYEPHVIGEHEYTMSTFNGSYSSPGASSGNSAVVEYVRQPNYAMSYIEFEINGATNYDVRITQIEMRLERPDSSKTPFLSKYGAETLYYPLTAPQFNGNLSGNASTATKLQTARTISLIGSITGSGTFDGSGNLSITTTTNHTHTAATTSANGFMSSGDKAKLDGITASADAVSFSRSLTSGTKIGTITINGTGTDLYAPTNTDTHWTTGLKVGASNTATANAAASNGSVYLNVLDNSTIRDSHKIVGSGATSVTSDANGVITISSTDNNTTYSAGAGLTLSGTQFKHSNSVTAATAAGDASKTLTFGGTFTIPTITYDAQGHITSKGTTTMTMPANPNTDTHWTTGITAGETGTTSNSATTNGNTFIKIKDNSTHRGQIKLIGSGATSVSSNAEGVITISSTDNNTTYGSMSVDEGTTGTATTNRVLTAANLKGIINAHAPTKTGSGASGTWGISISGNAASASKVNNKLTVGSKSYDGSAAVTIAASDLGLASAMLFLGTTTTAITDGATTNPVVLGGSNKTVTAGNVVLYGSKEFVWTGSAWEELGNEGSYKIVQAAVADPSASGTSNTFIATISQDTNGKITATKKTVAVTNSAPTLAWGTTSTIGTVAGTNLQVKMPANPNTDTKVTQTVTTSNAAYPLLLAPNGQTATTTTTSYFDSGVTLNPSTNTIAANVSGNAATATKLATARTIRTNLASTSAASFDGSANITPGITGTLPITNGGTGATTASTARANLGAQSKVLYGNSAPSDSIGSNGDIYIALESDDIKKDIVDLIYPVGSIYISMNPENPSTLFGGTWEAFGQGRVLIGAGTGNDGSTSLSFTASSTGGEYKHILSINELPSHSHKETASAYGYNGWSQDTTNNYCIINYCNGEDYHGPNTTLNMVTDLPTYSNTYDTGGSQSHNNIQPYIAVYMWRRIA